jgi:hypothetical protein
LELGSFPEVRGGAGMIKIITALRENKLILYVNGSDGRSHTSMDGIVHHKYL